MRYSGSKEKQSIQGGFSSGLYKKYISENRNLDICVADCGSHAVVVVSVAGIFRFKYIGHPSTTQEKFRPFSVTTDSWTNIFTADHDDHRIHIVVRDTREDTPDVHLAIYCDGRIWIYERVFFF